MRSMRWFNSTEVTNSVLTTATMKSALRVLRPAAVCACAAAQARTKAKARARAGSERRRRGDVRVEVMVR